MYTAVVRQADGGCDALARCEAGPGRSRPDEAMGGGNIKSAAKRRSKVSRPPFRPFRPFRSFRPPVAPSRSDERLQTAGILGGPPHTLHPSAT